MLVDYQKSHHSPPPQFCQTDIKLCFGKLITSNVIDTTSKNYINLCIFIANLNTLHNFYRQYKISNHQAVLNTTICQLCRLALTLSTHSHRKSGQQSVQILHFGFAGQYMSDVNTYCNDQIWLYKTVYENATNSASCSTCNTEDSMHTWVSPLIVTQHI